MWTPEEVLFHPQKKCEIHGTAESQGWKHLKGVSCLNLIYNKLSSKSSLPSKAVNSDQNTIR